MCRSPATCVVFVCRSQATGVFPCALVTMHCSLALQTGVADVSAIVFLAGWDCSGGLPTGAPSSECGDMLLTHPCVFGLNPVAATTTLRQGPQCDPDPCAENCGLTVSQVDEAICAMRCVAVVPACCGDHSWSAQKATSIELTIR